MSMWLSISLCQWLSRSDQIREKREDGWAVDKRILKRSMDSIPECAVSEREESDETRAGQLDTKNGILLSTWIDDVLDERDDVEKREVNRDVER